MVEDNQGNENERKRNPLETRGDQIGGPWDNAKTGGGEKNVGQGDDAGGGAGGMSVGSTGVVGGSADFLAGNDGDEPRAGPPSAQQGQVPSGNQSGEDSSFGGRTGSGTSAIASNTGHSDLGSAGVGLSGGGASSSGQADIDTAEPSGGSDFAPQGQGATKSQSGSEAEQDEETEESFSRDADVEGDSGAF